MPSIVGTCVFSAKAIEAALAAAWRQAEALGVKVNIALVDSGGNLAGFIRMPGAFLISIDLSIDKAYCAAGFGLSTRELGVRLMGLPEAVRNGLLRRPRLTEVPGGVPFLVDGVIAGGIGVSGASDEEDERIAYAGIAAIEVAKRTTT